MEGIKIEQSNIYYMIKYLGLTVDEKLTWKEHLTSVNNKISSTVEAIRRANIVTTEKTQKLIWNLHRKPIKIPAYCMEHGK